MFVTGFFTRTMLLIGVLTFMASFGMTSWALAEERSTTSVVPAVHGTLGHHDIQKTDVATWTTDQMDTGSMVGTLATNQPFTAMPVTFKKFKWWKPKTEPAQPILAWQNPITQSLLGEAVMPTRVPQP
jgi:hypothetical protein